MSLFFFNRSVLHSKKNLWLHRTGSALFFWKETQALPVGRCRFLMDVPCETRYWIERGSILGLPPTSPAPDVSMNRQLNFTELGSVGMRFQRGPQEGPGTLWFHHCCIIVVYFLRQISQMGFWRGPQEASAALWLYHCYCDSCAFLAQISQMSFQRGPQDGPGTLWLYLLLL